MFPRGSSRAAGVIGNPSHRGSWTHRVANSGQLPGAGNYRWLSASFLRVQGRTGCFGAQGLCCAQTPVSAAGRPASLLLVRLRVLSCHLRKGVARRHTYTPARPRHWFDSFSGMALHLHPKDCKQQPHWDSGKSCPIDRSMHPSAQERTRRNRKGAPS